MWAKCLPDVAQNSRTDGKVYLGSTSVAVLQRHFVERYITVAKCGYTIVSNKANEQ